MQEYTFWQQDTFTSDISTIDDRWLSVNEICKYLGICKNTVYKWIYKHGMPAHRMGRLWKFKKDQVDAWIEAGGAQTSLDEELTRGLQKAGLEI